MNGNLEPEENVMKDIPQSDWTENKDNFFAWVDDGIMDRVQDYIEALDWNEGDDIVVEIGGTVVSGIHQPSTANERWSVPYGVRKYNKDAFIVIKNLTRDPFVPSQPNPDLKQAHPYEPKS